MAEAMMLERDGLRCDLPQRLAPWGRPTASGKRASWAKAADGRLRPTRKVETAPGTKANAGLAPVREMLTTGVMIQPTVMFAFDGATHIAASGESFACGDVFSETNKDGMNDFLRLEPVKKDEGFKQIAERLIPGCSAPSHKHHYLIDYLAFVNRHSTNVELQTVTAEPERQPQPAQEASIGNLSKAKQKALFSKEMSDGRTKPKLPPYRIAALNTMKYAHDNFKPALNGDNPSKTAGKAGFVRVPIEVAHFTRDLTKAVWAYASEADIPARMALCIIHCAMRTLESCLKRVLTMMGERYISPATKNKVSDREVIDTHLNSRVWKDLSMRKLVSCDQKGQLNKVTLNGGEVRSAIYDLADDNSFLLAAIRTTYSKLATPIDPATIHLQQWEQTLRHWAKAMRAAYTMKATPEDRRTFREQASYYVISKATLVPEGLVWYDWQLFSLMPNLFDRYESLQLISQEGMEAYQKLNNGLQRNSNNFSNAGAIPEKVKLEGMDAVKVCTLAHTPLHPASPARLPLPPIPPHRTVVRLVSVCRGRLPT